jgi:hypothetical protein
VSRISAEKRALGLWIRAWQLAGNRWPPQSRAILRQIIEMIANAFVAASDGELSSADAIQFARETMTPFTAQRIYTGSEQDYIVDALTDAILAIEWDDTFPT